MRSRHARLRNSIKRRRQPLIERRALPTPERLRRAGADVERGDSGQITMRDSPLERAFARNALTAEQYSAGQKYRHHWYHAGLAGRLGSLDLNRVLAVDLGAYAGMAKTETQLFHRQRYREAVQAIGKIGSCVLEWAVCRELPLDQVGQALGWSSRAQAYAAALERMKAALDELCKLWGIGGEWNSLNNMAPHLHPSSRSEGDHCPKVERQLDRGETGPPADVSDRCGRKSLSFIFSP